MRRFIFLTIFVSLSSYLFSQDCNYELNEDDPYTGVSKKITENVRLVNWFDRLEIQFGNIDGQKVMIHNLTKHKTAPVFSQGDKTILLFAGNETVELTLHSENGKTVSTGIAQIHETGNYYSYRLIYELSQQQIDAMKGKLLIGIRYYNSGDFIQFDLDYDKRKIQKKIIQLFKNDINCI